MGMFPMLCRQIDRCPEETQGRNMLLQVEVCTVYIRPFVLNCRNFCRNFCRNCRNFLFFSCSGVYDTLNISYYTWSTKENVNWMANLILHIQKLCVASRHLSCFIIVRKDSTIQSSWFRKHYEKTKHIQKFIQQFQRQFISQGSYLIAYNLRLVLALLYDATFLFSFNLPLNQVSDTFWIIFVWYIWQQLLEKLWCVPSFLKM